MLDETINILDYCKEHIEVQAISEMYGEIEDENVRKVIKEYMDTKYSDYTKTAIVFYKETGR